MKNLTLIGKAGRALYFRDAYGRVIVKVNGRLQEVNPIEVQELRRVGVIGSRV